MIRISKVKEFIVMWNLPRVAANVAIALVIGCDRHRGQMQLVADSS